MSESHNPNLGSPAARLDLRSVVALLLAALLFLFVSQAVHKSPRSLAPPAAAALNQPAVMPQPEISHSGSQIAFGWLSFIATPLYAALRFTYSHCIANWGWAIILLTAAFNLVLIWPRLLAMNSSLKGMRLQPKLDAVRKRYAGLKMSDPRRAGMNAEMMAIYKADGASMYGGCLPMLLQLPLLFAYFRVLQNAPELHHAGWLWLLDLASPDPMHILPLFIVATMFLTQWITPMPAANRSQRRLLAIVMPLVMGFSLWHYASGVSLYWATGNLIGLAFQFIVNHSALGKQMQSLAAANHDVH